MRLACGILGRLGSDDNEDSARVAAYRHLKVLHDHSVVARRIRVLTDSRSSGSRHFASESLYREKLMRRNNQAMIVVCRPKVGLERIYIWPALEHGLQVGAFNHDDHDSSDIILPWINRRSSSGACCV